MAVGFKRQRLGDRLAGTLVVRALPLPQLPLPYVPADQSVSRCGACGALQPAGRQTCGVCGGRLAQPSRHGEPAADRLSDVAEAWRTMSAAGRSRAEASRGAPSRPQESGRLAAELRSDDGATRLTAARETLLEGSKADVTLLAKLAGDWDQEEQEFVVNVARTLLGWRPRVVLTALGQHADDELAASAREALETVVERTSAERGPRSATHTEPTDDDDTVACAAGATERHVTCRRRRAEGECRGRADGERRRSTGGRVVRRSASVGAGAVVRPARAARVCLPPSLARPSLRGDRAGLHGVVGAQRRGQRPRSRVGRLRAPLPARRPSCGAAAAAAAHPRRAPAGLRRHGPARGPLAPQARPASRSSSRPARGVRRWRRTSPWPGGRSLADVTIGGAPVRAGRWGWWGIGEDGDVLACLADAPAALAALAQLRAGSAAPAGAWAGAAQTP